MRCFGYAHKRSGCLSDLGHASCGGAYLLIVHGLNGVDYYNIRRSLINGDFYIRQIRFTQKKQLIITASYPVGSELYLS